MPGGHEIYVYVSILTYLLQDVLKICMYNVFIYFSVSFVREFYPVQFLVLKNVLSFGYNKLGLGEERTREKIN